MKSSPLVDVHVHLYPGSDVARRARDGYQIWEYGTYPGVLFDEASGLVEELTSRYDQHGFDHAVAMMLFDSAAERANIRATLDEGRSEDEASAIDAAIDEAVVAAAMGANRWLVRAAGARPGLSAYVGLDPCLLGSARLLDHLEEMADLGASGIKLHPVAHGFHPNDEVLHPVYERCSELGLVVLAHSGPGHRASASARPSDFAAVARHFSQLRLVLAHLGGAAYQETVAFASDFPQVAFDVSEIIEWVGAPNAPSQAELSALITTIGADRVMMGSDYPWYDPVGSAEKVDALPGFGTEERRALLGGTAVRVLGLENGLRSVTRP
jgi:uncharacterized protein